MVECVNTKDLKLCVQKVYDLKDGGIKIQCKSKDDAEKLKKEATEKMGDKYETKMQEKKYPKIKIIGLEENYTNEDLENSIRHQNSAILENSKIKVVVVKKMKTKYMAILEVDPETFKKIMESGMLLVDLSVCTVFEHVDLLRCFRCTGYHHTNKNCKSNTSFCLKCGLDNHSTPDCSTAEKDFCCPNCSDANKKYKLNFFINHGPFDRTCEIFKKKTDAEKRKILYE